jgi:hypothetical protein
MEKTQKALVIANLCLWIYFWAAFAHAAYAFRPDPLGHPAGAGYTFWGHSISVVESGLVYPFFKVVFYAEFPSFALATLIAEALSPHLLLNGFFCGISGGGWLLLGVMVLSFFRWYLVAWVALKLWQKWLGHPTGIRKQSPSPGPMPTDATT